MSENQINNTVTRIRWWPFMGWEPQQKYTMGAKDGVRWFPLDKDGFWLEPDAFSYGKITKHNYFPKAEARRIALRAAAINQHHLG